MIEPKVKTEPQLKLVEPHSSVTVTTNDTVGATFLGMFALVLLFAYLRAQARNHSLEKMLFHNNGGPASAV